MRHAKLKNYEIEKKSNIATKCSASSSNQMMWSICNSLIIARQHGKNAHLTQIF